MFIPNKKRYILYIYYSWYQKICVYLYRNKTKNSINIQKQKQNNYKYAIFSPEKNNARISIGKTIRKRPQNKLARRVVRRKEERKRKKNLLAAMVRRFFYLWCKIMRKETARAEYTDTKSVCVYTEQKTGVTIYIL